MIAESIVLRGCRTGGGENFRARAILLTARQYAVCAGALDTPAKGRDAAGMPSDPPVDPPSDLPKDAPATDSPAVAAEPVAAEPVAAEPVAAVVVTKTVVMTEVVVTEVVTTAGSVSDAVDAPPVAPAPAEPVSPAKEWAAAVVLMIVLALISAAFMSAFRG